MCTNQHLPPFESAESNRRLSGLAKVDCLCQFADSLRTHLIYFQVQFVMAAKQPQEQLVEKKCKLFLFSVLSILSTYNKFIVGSFIVLSCDRMREAKCLRFALKYYHFFSYSRREVFF